MNWITLIDIAAVVFGAWAVLHYVVAFVIERRRPLVTVEISAPVTMIILAAVCWAAGRLAYLV